MAYLDYSLPETIDLSGVSKIGDALTDVMKRRQQRQQFEQEMNFKYADADRKYKQEQDNIAYQNRIIDERNRRERLEFGAKQQERMAAAADRARHAASPQEAQAILHSAVMFDPETGKEIGRGSLEAGPTRDIGPAPQAPTEPQFPAAEAGAVIPDIAQALPGAPPELAAMMRGKRATQPPSQQSSDLETLMQRALPDSSLDEAHRAELANLQAGAADRKGKVFVDRIDDQGNAFLFDENGTRHVVPAQQGWQEGQWIAPPGSDQSVQRFDPSVEAARFENPNRGDEAVAAYDKYQQDRAAFDRDTAALPGRQAVYAAEQRQAEAERPYTIKFGPNDQGATFDFRTQRTAAAEAVAQQFVDNLPPNLTPEQQDAAKQTYFALKSGADPKKTQEEFARTIRLGREQGFKHQEGLLRDQAALERAKLRGESPMVAIARQGLGLRTEEAGNRQFQDFLRNQGYKADVATMKDLVDTNESLKVGNSALDVTAGAQFAKKAQGAGVLTDKDYDRFWSAIGGAGERPENWFDMAIEGKMGEGKRRIVIDAIRHKVDYEANRLKTVAVQADKKFAGEPWYPGTRQAYFDFLPGLPAMGQAGGPRIGSTRRAPPEVNARIKAKGKGVTPEAVGEVLKRILEAK